MTDDTWWNDHHEEPSARRGAWQYPARVVMLPGTGKSAALDIIQPLARAIQLGAEHGRAGTTPYGDLEQDDSALMTALGETSPTAEDNHPRRLALLQAYRDAYQTAREG